MIENENQFHVTLQQLGRLLRGLDDLRNTILPKNPQLFSALSEGVLDDIDQLRIELEEYEPMAKVAG